MKNFFISFLIALLPFVFYVVYSYFLTENYYKWSDEDFKLCLKSLEQSNLPFNVCSQISSAANRAFSRAVSIYNPIIILLLICFGTLSWRMIDINKRLKELENKLND